MWIYIVIGICLILDIINPKILWNIDFWKYQGDKPDPSTAYMVINRVIAAIALAALIIAVCASKM